MPSPQEIIDILNEVIAARPLANWTTSSKSGQPVRTGREGSANNISGSDYWIRCFNERTLVSKTLRFKPKSAPLFFEVAVGKSLVTKAEVVRLNHKTAQFASFSKLADALAFFDSK